MHTHNVVH